MDKETENSIKNYAWPVTSVNREDYDSFFEWFESHQDLLSTGIVVWGAGIRGSEFSCYFTDRGVSNIVYTDSNESKWNGYINDYKIIPPSEVLGNKEKYPYILISVENSEKICEILEANGYCRNRSYFTIDTTLYKKYIDRFCNMEGKEYLFMGDCEFSKISIHDECKTNLGEMLIEKLNEPTGVLAMHGMGLRSHYIVLQDLIAQDKAPQKLCLMVNFDTLTGKQHLLPRAQHEPLFRSLLAYSVTEEFKEYWEVTKERSQNIQSEMFVGNEFHTANEKMQRARVYFKLNYMYSLNLENEGILYLKKIIHLCEDRKIKCLVFLPPVNYEYASILFNDKFLERYNENVKKLRSVMTNHDVVFLDLSFSMKSDSFAEQETPDETMNYSGRINICNVLAERMEAL